LIGKLVVLEPLAGVPLPGVLLDVCRWAVPRQDGYTEDLSAENLGPPQGEAMAPVLTAVIVSSMTRVVAAVGTFSLISLRTPADV
jgi:hypothetical protein